MARDPLNRAFGATAPGDLLDPPRFSQLTETTKDVLVLELRKFLANAQQTASRRAELITIEKYATFADGNDPFSTAVDIIRKHPDKLENLPHVAVLGTTMQERKLTIGPPIIATVQEPPRVLSTETEPYALVDGEAIVLRTTPNGRNAVTERIVFTATRFPTAAPIGEALAVDVVRVINEQALHVRARVFTEDASNFVLIEAGGPLDVSTGLTPSEIEVHVDTDENVWTVFGLGRSGVISDLTVDGSEVVLSSDADSFTEDDVGAYVTIVDADRPYFNDGRFLITSTNEDDTINLANRYGRTVEDQTATWFIGQRDTNRNTARPPMHRYGQSADLTLQVDVITDDENSRGELVDLVFSFFTFFLEQKYFTFVGRTGFQGETATGETYQVILNPPVASVGEAEFPRSGDGSGKVYVNSFSINATTSMYVDREVYFPTTDTPFIVDGRDLEEDATLPFPEAISDPD